MFYGHPATVERHLSWSLLSSFGQQKDLSWLCTGDFNEILRVQEQLEGNV